MLKDTNQETVFMHDFRWRTTELVHRRCLKPARHLSCYSGARIPYRLLIEVSQQDEEQFREEPRGKENARAGKNNWLLFFFIYVGFRMFSNTQIGLLQRILQ